MDSAAIYTHVTDRYSATARGDTVSHHVKTVAEAFGYSAEELASVPAESNLGLSCGNPLALAGLKEGEIVVDLGCGAGFDVFMAAKKLGGKGQAIGVDMNDDMLAKAQKNASNSQTKNVSFIKSRITSIDLPDASADVVISNCVINLVPDAEKHLVFKEMHRLLKPGGRVAVSDILTKKSLPEDMKQNVALYVGCVSGASSKEEYELWLKEAGFEDVAIVDAGSDLNVYTSGDVDTACYSGFGEEKDAVEVNVGACCGGIKEKDGGVAADMKRDLSKLDLNEWAGSYKVFAVKR